MRIKEGKSISHELIYRCIRGDATRELKAHTRHKMKYNKKKKRKSIGGVRNIPGRIGIGERPKEADGNRFGDWEMDTIIGKNGKGAILTLTERSTNMLIMEKLRRGKNPMEVAKVVRKAFVALQRKNQNNNHR